MTTNQPYLLALQVVPSIAWGGTGVAKSATAAALAAALKRAYIPLNGSTHLPEDFSGYPNPDFKAGVVRQMPTSWVEQAMKGTAFVFLDELTTVPQATMAGLLSVITERRVGDVVLPATTIIAAAANPPELAPNSAPLPVSMRSRFFHWTWEIDRELWFSGLRNGCRWDAPKFPLVPQHWMDNLPSYGALVEQFLRANPDCVEQLPPDDATLAFPNPRTWTYLVRCFAAASAVGYKDQSPMFKALAKGCVGDAASSEISRFIAMRDLIDPEAVLDGTHRYEFVKRPDLNICLLTGLVQGLRRNNSPERWVNAANVFIEMGKNGEIETCLMAFKPFWNDTKAGGVRPAGWVPPKPILTQLMGIARV